MGKYRENNDFAGFYLYEQQQNGEDIHRMRGENKSIKNIPNSPLELLIKATPTQNKLLRSDASRSKLPQL